MVQPGSVGAAARKLPPWDGSHSPTPRVYEYAGQRHGEQQLVPMKQTRRQEAVMFGVTHMPVATRQSCLALFLSHSPLGFKFFPVSDLVSHC
jgi:hypothetical protein